jgi:hypothetical protein
MSQCCECDLTAVCGGQADGRSSDGVHDPDCVAAVRLALHPAIISHSRNAAHE